MTAALVSIAAVEPAVAIRALAPSDFVPWRRLWNGYLAFYETTLPEAVSRSTFDRLTGGDPTMFGRVAVMGGAIVGIANCILHAGTFADEPRCYLEDLFVDPTVRGVGVGRTLIDDLIALGQAEGWYQLYWHTRESNGTARRLYDRYTPAEDFVCYRVDIEPN